MARVNGREEGDCGCSGTEGGGEMSTPDVGKTERGHNTTGSYIVREHEGPNDHV